uniref:aralkylamine N-acetyltransferase n=1 Tax=Plectus sambesii TaxID=2011161 RepID=A0A914VI58_9BILA
MSSLDDLKFEMATAEDEKEITELLVKNFKPPMGVALNMEHEDMICLCPSIVRRCLSCPLSMVVRNAEGKIIAVQLVTIHNRQDEQEEHDRNEAALTEKAVKIVKFMTHMEGDLWQLVPLDVNCLMRFNITFVMPEYQRHGIARRLSSMRLDAAKQLGCQGITTTSISIKSQKLRLSEGFEVVKEVKYKDWLDENGKVIFDIKDDETDRSILTFKRL